LRLFCDACPKVRRKLRRIAARAIVLAGHLLNSFVRNSESRRKRLFPRDTNENANIPDSYGEFLRVFSTRHEN
jgi:hypothetical protein